MQESDDGRGNRTIQSVPDPKEGDDTITIAGSRPDGVSTLPLDEVKIGTKVFGYHAEKDELLEDRVVELYKSSPCKGFAIVNGSRKLLPIHRVMARAVGQEKGEWTEIRDLEQGRHELRLGTGAWELIEKLVPYIEDTEAYGLRLNPCTGYVRGGIVVSVKEEFRIPR